MMLARKQPTDPRSPSPRPLRRVAAAPASRSLRPSAALHPLVGARLRLGARNDRHEREADRVAKRVMEKSLPGGAQRHHPPPSGRLESVQAGSRPLAQPLRDFFEPRFGYDFSDVRLHTDTRAAGMAESIQARAFAVGNEVFFGRGEFASETSRGRELMAHELTHVVQQERGTIRRQPKKESPEFPDLPNLALKLEDDIGQNLFDYGHHFYRLATLYPDRPELLQEAFGRYALGANVLTTGFRFLGLDQTAANRLAIGSGILLKGLTFASKGEVVLDFQFDIGRGLKLETNFNLGVDPDDYSKVKKADVGIGVVGHF
jgi:hypothetical protein